MSFRILIVDDNFGDAKLFSTLFRAADPGMQIRVVHDGEEALRQLHDPRGNPVDILLLDLNVPKKSGIEVLADLRADPKLRELPVFVLTTSDSPDDRERALALGVEAFYTKPVEFEKIEELISRMVAVDFPRVIAPSSAPAKEATAAPKAPAVLSAENYRRLVESAKDYAIFMLDVQGRILSWNEGAQRSKGYAPAEIIGKHFSVFYTPEDIARQHPAHELLIAEREGRYQEEGWRVRKDGTRFWASVTITAIRDDVGNLIGFGKVTRDMTDRKLAEEKLRESEERFRILIEGVRDYAIFMLDPAGHIVSWNLGAERAEGYKAAEVLGKHFSIFYTAEDRARRHPEFELQTASQKGVYEEEGIRIRKDGTTFWATVVITAIHGADGRLRGYAKVTRDISERKKAEQEIRDMNIDLEKRVRQRTAELEESKTELERSNADLRQFAYVASHDLQEPLRMVVSYLQYLTRTASVKLDADENQFIDFAVSGALRMRMLVQDLLAYARIERSNELPENVAPIAEPVDEARANLVALLKEADATLVVDDLPRARFDHTQLAQVFQNLIANALTYRSPDRKPDIHIGTRDYGDGMITVFVKDNGIGIAPEYFQKIFIIFQRLHSDRDKYPGTGIGLAICKKIVERHRGAIWLESTLGEGTTFLFTLPRQ